jgi:phosphatidate cytidylyltransferase
MLKTRIITAVALLAILLPAMFYPNPVAFNAVALVLIGAAAWEWGKLNACSQSASFLIAACALFICGTAWFSGLIGIEVPVLWIATGAVWVLVGGWLLVRGPLVWPEIPQTLRLVVGVLALCLAWLALAQARLRGVEFLLSVLLLVWVADIGAYFAGRTLGGRFTKSKLAPSISPGKTWEGVWGAVVSVLVMAFVWASISSGNVYAQLQSRHGWVFLAVAALFLVAMSVVGDLVESLVKRAAGAKDSSNLLPGHGGVLDRVDALLPALPLAMMLVSL